MTITGRGEEKGYFAQDNIDFYTHWQEAVRLSLPLGRQGFIRVRMHVIREWLIWMTPACFRP